ncbi:MAG: DUF2911 domain-containing protein [Bacteroidota bacterium]
MKKGKFILSSVLAMFVALHVMGQGVTLPRASASSELKQTVGITDVIVNYSRPSVIGPQGNDRTGAIWGQVVPYGYNNLGFGTSTAAPWRAGANENTVIEFTTDVKVEGKDLAAGKYGLHMALEESGKVTAIFSKNISSWGSFFYDQAEDALRVDVQSVEIPQTNLLTFNFIEVSNNGATLTLDWEKKRIPFKIEVNTPEVVYASLKDELRTTPGFNHTNWNAAANYLLTNNIHLEDALTWADASINAPFIGQKNFNNLQVKARALAALGKSEEATKAMDAALADPAASINNYYNYGRFLIGQDRKTEALDIFTKASKKWPEHWLAPHGLARGYSANGEIKKALKYEKEAHQKAPDGSKTVLAGYIKTLESGKDFN